MNITLAIRPSRDLRNHYSDISDLSRERPVAITVNGREDVVVINHEAYEKQQDYIAELETRLSVYDHLAKSQDDIRLGRVKDVDQAFDEIMTELDEYGKKFE